MVNRSSLTESVKLMFKMLLQTLSNLWQQENYIIQDYSQERESNKLRQRIKSSSMASCPDKVCVGKHWVVSV